MASTGTRRSARLRNEAPGQPIADPVAIERASSAARRSAGNPATGITGTRGRGTRGARRGRGGQRGRGGARGGGAAAATPAPQPQPTKDSNNERSGHASGDDPTPIPSLPDPNAQSASAAQNGAARQSMDGVSGPLADPGDAAHNTAPSPSTAGSSGAQTGARSGTDAAVLTASTPPEASCSAPQAERASVAGPETAPNLTPTDFCEELATLLGHWKQNAAEDKSAPPNDPVIVSHSLGDEMIWRAIAGVTEAISSNGIDAPQFSLFDPVAFRMWQDIPDVPIHQQAARPGNEAFLVRTDGTRGRTHNSLYFVRNTGDSSFEIRSFDSATGNWHRRNNQARADRFLQALSVFGWDRADPALVVAPAVRRSEPAARQVEKWECGLYVIVYAWALALGLETSIATFTGISRQRDFVARAAELVNLSLQGYCSSKTIEAFLKCFQVVGPTAATAPGRDFERTIPFRTENDLRLHVARSRIKHELQAEGSPSLTVLLEVIRRSNPTIESSLFDFATGEVLEEYAKASSLHDVGSEAPWVEMGPDSVVESARADRDGQAASHKRGHEDEGREQSSKRRQGGSPIELADDSSPLSSQARTRHEVDESAKVDTRALSAENTAPHVTPTEATDVSTPPLKSKDLSEIAGNGRTGASSPSNVPTNGQESSSSHSAATHEGRHGEDSTRGSQPSAEVPAVGPVVHGSHRASSPEIAFANAGAPAPYSNQDRQNSPAQPKTTSPASDVLLRDFEAAEIRTSLKADATPSHVVSDTLGDGYANEPLGALDDLFGDDAGLYASGATRPRPSLQLDHGVRSPGLALPPPTPRNTGPRLSPSASLPGPTTLASRNGDEDSEDEDDEATSAVLSSESSDARAQERGTAHIQRILDKHGVNQVDDESEDDELPHQGQDITQFSQVEY
ncbi:hypothetical protein CERZMDRAFT_84204 [Cercospora zeae-maydis SCOH1-5]|uniref:Ubiquitin-like protease family profile domain-containing protein n=1 Tax=Cercospora zeae-maydis SCOH1-5 TaxID=717836 RepID=A0A6A6FGF7_9PEZI|nr:hypothetical protein CERZMDRAFT_84204 [Cercospora zeae-maydis SCOH1-5]